MMKVKQQQQSNSKYCCNSNIRSFIRFISGKQKKYTIIKESEPEKATVKVVENPKKQVKQEFISCPKREKECKQYHFKGEIILVANDNLRFQEWLRLVESSK